MTEKLKDLHCLECEDAYDFPKNKKNKKIRTAAIEDEVRMLSGEA